MRPSRAAAADAALAVAFSALVLVELGARWDDGYSAGPDLLNLPLLWLVTGALAVRRRYPVAATAVAFAAVVVPSLVVPHTVFFFGTLVPLAVLTWTTARHTGPAVAALAGPVALLLAVPLHQPDFDLPDYLFGTVLFGSAWLAGRAQRALDRRGGALSRELAAQVRDQGERERALLADERGRIARELHDVVAHAVSVMVVQAGAARLAVGAADDEVREGLHAVEDTGRAALLDLRRLLGVLHPGDGSSAPRPGLAALPDLVARMRAAGLEVALHDAGGPDLPAGLDLTAYRIVQEALTNALKHAGPTDVRVGVERRPRLRIEVVDAGPRSGHRGERRADGHGLVGMRERVALFEGTVSAERCGAGWAVRAVLPVP